MTHVLLTDADGLRAASQPADLLVLLITRDEIRRGTVGDVVDRLMVLSDDSDNVVRYAQRLVVVIDGYNDDPRELTAIPEVVEFIRAIDREWSYWFHFLSTEHDSLMLVLHMLLHLAPVSRDDAPASGKVFNAFDPDELVRVVQRHLASMQLLHWEHGVSASRSESLSTAVMACIESSLL